MFYAAQEAAASTIIRDAVTIRAENVDAPEGAEGKEGGEAIKETGWEVPLYRLLHVEHEAHRQRKQREIGGVVVCGRQRCATSTKNSPAWSPLNGSGVHTIPPIWTCWHQTCVPRF